MNDVKGSFHAATHALVLCQEESSETKNNNTHNNDQSFILPSSSSSLHVVDALNAYVCTDLLSTIHEGSGNISEALENKQVCIYIYITCVYMNACVSVVMISTYYLLLKLSSIHFVVVWDALTWCNTYNIASIPSSPLSLFLSSSAIHSINLAPWLVGIGHCAYFNSIRKIIKPTKPRKRRRKSSKSGWSINTRNSVKNESVYWTKWE